MINWLPISDRKNIRTVRFQIEKALGQNYSVWYSFEQNLISLVEVDCEKRLASIIAHEYRHHVQREIRNVPIVNIRPRVSTYESYEADIKWYFTSSPSEYDALLYENKVAKSDLSEYWLKHCLTNTR